MIIDECSECSESSSPHSDWKSFEFSNPSSCRIPRYSRFAWCFCVSVCTCCRTCSWPWLPVETCWNHQPIGVVMKCLGTPLPPGRNSCFCVLPIQAMVPRNNEEPNNAIQTGNTHNDYSKLNLKWILHPETTPILRKKQHDTSWDQICPSVKGYPTDQGDVILRLWIRKTPTNPRGISNLYIVLGEHVFFFFGIYLGLPLDSRPWAIVSSPPNSNKPQYIGLLS